MNGAVQVEGGEQKPPPSLTIAHQKVELDIDFSQQVRGKTEITIYPGSPDLRVFGLNARQCQISSVLINGLAPSAIIHRDPCDDLALHFENSNIHQHHLLSSRIDSTKQAVPEPSLIITLPKTLRIQDVDIAEVHTQNAGVVKITNPEAQGVDAVETTQGLTDTSVAKYTPLIVTIEFSTTHLREAVQFVTGKRGTGRWPHAYTRGSGSGAHASALFPCVDSLPARCTWDIAITCPRTVGDAINQSLFFEGLTLEDKHRERAAYENKEMLILCSGKLNEVSINQTDSTKKTASFSVAQQLSAQQLGFAVGPFEKVSLNAFRDADDIAKLGENAVNMLGYALPGRSEEVKNTCLATPKAIDMFVQKYIACPSHAFTMCFVEDLPHDVSVFAGTSICSTRLLYAEDVIDPAQEITRKLVHAIASQWSGINIIPETPVDMWVIVGMAHYMTDLFMRDLCGNNEYRYRIRKQADRIFDVDRERPSLYETGKYLHVDPSLYGFLCLKAPIVLFILDRRIHKSAGASKMPGIIAKILTRARTGDLINNAVSTDLFQRTVERFYHASIAEFVDQWVMKSGCPRFRAFQRFNKKKLVVEMSIQQVPSNTLEKELDPHTFVRDVREEWEGVYAGEQKSVFTGPMTIRIHEADGTPYEHIVQIKESKTVIEVPYNTKYKRLKRSKRQRTKPSARNAEAGEEDNDSLVYCLGDTLQSEEEVRDWRITEWSAEDEERMNAESYEWIRLDADFEWIARIELQMPGYMYTSQVQQDRDVVAQLEAVKAIGGYPAQPLVSSILIRTLMDKRYFHGVRYIAAQGLVKHATDDNEANWIGLFHLKKAFEELFCNTDGGSAMTKPNDFQDQQKYMVQTAIVEAISKVRNKQGHTPMDVKEWLLDKLKFNDNSNNEFSDAYYINKLMHALTNAIIARRTQASIGEDDMDLDIADELDKNRKIEQSCLDEIDRYRRMDEWTSSYQNLYSRSALQCQAKLMDAGIATFSPLHFLQYTRPGNYEVLRGVAYEVLVRPEILDGQDSGKASVLRYIVHCMVGDSSPWIRSPLQRLMGVALARRAIGGPTSTSTTTASTTSLQAPEQNDSLVIEGVEAQDSKELDIARRQNVEAALEALKKEIGNKNETLKTALWAAVNHADITLEDLAVMLDFCGMLYQPKYELKLELKYPRYYRVRNLGKGKLHFSLSDKVRTKKIEKWEPPKPSAPLNVVPPPLQPRASQPTLKLKLGSSVSRTPSTSQPQSQYSVQPPPKKQKTVSPKTSAKTSARSTPMPEQAKQTSPPAPSQRITLKLSRPSLSGN